MKEIEKKIFIVKSIRDEFEKRGIILKKLILFGSRARGDAHSNSDWDFLAITAEPQNRTVISDIRYSISCNLAKQMIDTELIVQDENSFNKRVNDVGMITYYAFRDGIPV